MDFEYKILGVVCSGMALVPSIKNCYKGHSTLINVILLSETKLMGMKYVTDILVGRL
jgi:hypothetical protein